MMVQCVATGDTGMQTGYEAPGRTMGFELFDTVRARGGRPHRGDPRADACSTRCPRRPGSIPVVLRRGAGGVLFHEACGHGLEADHIYKDASVFSGDMGELRRVAVGDARRRRHVRPRVGHARDRRRRPSRAAQRADRRRRAHRVHVGPAARAQGRSREQRQRPARDLQAPADAAHDQHVRARRRDRSRRRSCRASSTASTACSSAAAR